MEAGRIERGLEERDRGAGRIACAGAIVLAGQNALLFAGFLLWLEDPNAGFALGFASLFLDVPGVILLGLGIRSLTVGSPGPGSRRAAWSARLCFLGAGLTIAWRWLLPAATGRTYVDVFDAILASGVGGPPELRAHRALVAGMFALWIAASAVLVAASYLLRLSGDAWPAEVLLGPRPDLRSWEGFLTLNAVGTGLVAWQMLAVLLGGEAGGFLTAGLAIKVVAAPLNGAFTYGLIAWRAHRALAPHGVGPRKALAEEALGQDREP